MVVYFDSQDSFTQHCDEDKFWALVESQNISHQTPTAIQNLCCHICKQIPTLVYSNGSNHQQYYAMRLSCGNCQTFWNFCGCCSSDHQPSAFTRYTRRQSQNNRRLSIHNITNALDSSLESHASMHNNSLENNDLSMSVDDKQFIHEDSIQSNNPDPRGVESFVINIISNMFDNNVMSNFDINLKEALIRRETNQKYPDYLIKKFWLKNTRCSLKSDDVIVFLRHLRYIMQQSRDENNELSYILSYQRKKKVNQFDVLTSRLQAEKEKNVIAYKAIKSLKALLQSNGISFTSNLDNEFHSIQDNEIEDRNDDYIDLRIPTTFSDMRKILDAKHSLLNNILIPPVLFHDSGNAYVKPSDALRLAICTGVPFEIVSGSNYDCSTLHKRSIYRAPIFKKIISQSNIEDDVITVIYGFWSDGCYCGTESKGKRNLAKMATIHVSHYHVTERHVFPIVFGKKGDDEEDVRKTIIEDMVSLSKRTVPCYIPAMKEVRKVRFLLGYAILDRVEHAETTCFMGATGTFSRQVCLSCPISTIQGNAQVPYSLCKSLRSCWSCWNKRVDLMKRGFFREAQRSRRCLRCYNWDLNAVEYYHHPNFPVDCIPDGEVSAFHANSLKSKAISFVSMKQACSTIFDKVKRGEWTQSKAEHYARRECIRESVWKKV